MQILEPTIETVLPLTAFLTAAIWLAAFAERAGVADALATRLWRAAGGRPARLYGLTCLLCAGLTGTVSLDGAVVLMVPVLLALTERAPDLRRALLFGAVGVANAFSLALPQGNPTNLLVIRRLGIQPANFVTHLFAPALLATLVATAVVAIAERRALGPRREATAAPGRSLPVGPRGRAAASLALTALAAAALAGAVAPWIGVAPWWTLCGVAALTAAAARLTRFEIPVLEVPWRICAQVAVLVAAFSALPHLVHAPPALGPAALVAIALTAAAVASVVNNLPATIAFASLLGATPLPAYAALTGLSIGALATPRGSVATLLAFDRAHEPKTGYLRRWLPTAAGATIAATLLLAMTSGP